MYPLLINPIPLLLTLGTAFGVLVHDTQMDAAAKTALTTPISIVGFLGNEGSLKLNDPHIHTESLSISQGVRDLKDVNPRTQTRGGDDKKYVIQKKSSIHSYGSEYIWPST